MQETKKVVFVGFNPEHTKKTQALVWKCLGIASIDVPTVYFVWNDNVRLISDLAVDASRFEVSSRGSNDLWEWSGYSQGLSNLLTMEVDCESILFLNDTAFKHAHSEKIISLYLNGAADETSFRQPYIMGRYDQPKVPLTFELSQSLSGWISTFCFVLTKELYFLVNEVCIYLSHFNIDNRRPNATLIETFFDEIHPTMAAHLNWWLFGGGWYKSEPLTNDNYVMFRKKLRSILGEFKLTQLCRNRAKIISV